MLQITKVVQLRGRFTPLLERFILHSSKCYLKRNVCQNASYTTCWNKKRYPVFEGQNIAPRVTVAHSSTLQGEDSLVYHGNLTPQVRMVKVFSLCSSIAGLVSQPILYKHASEFGGTGVLIGVATFVGFFTFVTPVLLHLITRKYVTDIHHNAKTGVYTATLLTFFLGVKKVSFLANEVVVPDVPGLFTTFKVKGSSLFVDPRMFEDPNHYGKLMGYDKPIDFLLKKDISSDETEERVAKK
ncbi:transmembrane protein 70 homolog, mitochondrial [Hetaerina americana]|uniref:transmembrane protein 70 homolog, mitochondrial n=1 Tax=Hetaerina americana TaxID=62018 RepID=UPI003A7F219F